VRSKADKKQLDLAHGIKNRKKQGKVKKRVAQKKRSG